MSTGMISAFLLLVSSSGVMATQQDTVDAIERLEEELNSAFNRLDAAALDRLWSDDLQFISLNGSVATKAERLAGLEPRPASVPLSTIESVEVRPYFQVAVAIVVSKWTGTDPEQPFSTRYRATHLWVVQDGRWRLVTAQVSRIVE